MNYLYENLGDERFQELCQALLAKAFPEVQCFPVGQPDGGRDAISFVFHEGSSDRSFNVFQVKYNKRPLAEPDPHKWLTEILRDEVPKVQRLIPKGAKAYYLLTNVPGTAHPDAGSIDKVQALLDSALTVPAQCWWRDDLNRRLDDAWDLKWAYPEVLAGTDFLRLLIEESASGDRERRQTAIRAFVRAQYTVDEEVKFKQVELQNKLLDLFVDVPLSLREGADTAQFFLTRHGIYAGPAQGDSEHSTAHDGRQSVGAARFFLDAHVQEHLAYAVLEGAPGQGKSTLAQYICQIHRMRLLGESATLAIVPPDHRPTAVRIPLRVDLRDYATWLGKEDPFAPDEHAPAPPSWNKSLEAFLAAQVRHVSGGLDFSVDDLHAIARRSALLLVLDGLDEVADIAKRTEVVSEVKTGVGRLKDSAASLQVIITSRPAAFSNAPGFPPKVFPHFRLVSLTRDLIISYADRWLAARRVQGREAADTKRILNQKLEQPHLMALARNPMQLAILLTLIHSRGSSLPDKRTALYDNYVDLFLSRETEKSPIVREHRDLLGDLHRHLAWVLHAEAEKGRNRGSVSVARLQRILEDYLRDEERDPALVGKLFHGMVERVVFLVSRVEGTYEFEVQPLREYFAARHLYETAPYSPPGAEKRGTKPDRFDALARNFYWLNVTRFFAGCFSKGELPTLIDRLQELAKLEGYQDTNHPQRLAAMLLSDWVFSQHQRSTREAVALVLGSFGLRHILSAKRRRMAYVSVDDEALALPEGCGRRELIEECFKVLDKTPRRDYALEVVELLRANSTSDELTGTWASRVVEAKERHYPDWLDYGLYLGVLARIDEDKLGTLVAGRREDHRTLRTLHDAGRVTYVEAVDRRVETLVNAILGTDYRPRRKRGDLLSRLGWALDPYRYGRALQYPAPRPLFEVMRQHEGAPVDDEDGSSLEGLSEQLVKCRQFVEVAAGEAQKDATEWATNLEPWETVIERGRALWGDQWAFYELATVAAGIRSPETRCPDGAEVFDRGLPLCRRARYARLRTGAPTWWKQQAANAKSETDAMWLALLFFAWASMPTILKSCDTAGELLGRLSSNAWDKLARSIRYTLLIPPSRGRRRLNEAWLPATCPERVVALLGVQLGDDDIKVLYRKYLRKYDGTDRFVLELCEEAILNLALKEPSMWREALEFSAKSYAHGGSAHRMPLYSASPGSIYDRLPYEIARQIVAQPEKYARQLIQFAAERCRFEVAGRAVALADIAEREGWFSAARRA